MRWPIKQSRGWHRWFAWYPVRIKGFWHWLEIVERVRVNEVDYFKPDDGEQRPIP